MKNKTFIETSIRISALLLILLSALKCAAQDARIETAVGLIVFCQSEQPDEICFSFGVESGQLQIEHLDKCAATLVGRVAAAARMADDAADKYPDFCRTNGVNDSPSIQAYYRKCQALRRQFLEVMPERALIELHHQTQYFR